MEEERIPNKDKRPLMRNRKGWIGFVHGYKDWLKSDGYEGVKWNEDPENSGAKEVVREKGKIIYKF
jgi:hypothetical protein